MDPWVVPGLAVVVASIGLTLARLILRLVTGRPLLRLLPLAHQLRLIGLGTLVVGMGASVAVPALFEGPDIGSLVVGVLIVGLGGLSFIAASDPMFKTGMIAVPPHWKHRSTPMPGTTEETLDARAKRLHELVHPEDASRSTTDRE